MKLSYAGKFWLFIGLPGCVAFWAAVISTAIYLS